MEYIDGDRLYDHVERDTSAETILEWARQLSSALAANAVLARFPVLRGCFVAGAALFRPLFTTLGLKHVKPIPIALHSLSGTVLGVLLDRPPLVGRTFTFDALPDALRHLQSGSSTGKVVVVVGE